MDLFAEARRRHSDEDIAIPPRRWKIIMMVVSPCPLLLAPWS